MARTTRTCSKVKYRDRIAALLALASTHRTDGSRRDHLETRAYRCDRCHAWHLTSAPAR